MIAASLAITLGGCETVIEQPSARLSQTELYFADGSPAGTARLIGQGDRIDISVALTGMREGLHGLRLREVGDCAAAGGPILPGGALPDAIVNSSGSANVSATLPGTHAQVLARILDSDGSAIIVHQGTGDQQGPALACGVFSRS